MGTKPFSNVSEYVDSYLKEHGKMPTQKLVRENVTGQCSRVTAEYSELRKQAKYSGKNETKIGTDTKKESPFIELPESPIRDFNNYPEIEAGCLILSDLHFPSHDKAWIERCVKYAIDKGIRRLVINGDLLDLPNLSKHGLIPNYDTELELDFAETFFRWARQYFSEIHVVLGNHCQRFAKKVDNQISTKRFIKLLAQDHAEVYEHHHAYIGKTWLAAHPANYSRAAAKVALDLIGKFHKNVCIGHTHKIGFSFDPSGNYVAVETGGCFHPSKVAYTHIELSNFPVQLRGAIIVFEDESFQQLHERVKF